MDIYMAYKYSNVENKEGLIEDLNLLSDILVEQGHKTFILGRDVQGWGKISHPSNHKFKTIVRQIKASDHVVAYVNANVFSFGLYFELLTCKLFFKPVSAVFVGDSKDFLVKLFSKKKVIGASLGSLRGQISNLFS